MDASTLAVGTWIPSWLVSPERGVVAISSLGLEPKEPLVPGYPPEFQGTP